MRICKSRGRDWNDGVVADDVDDDGDVDAVGDDDEVDDDDDGDIGVGDGLGRDGANGGPTHVLARLQHQM